MKRIFRMFTRRTRIHRFNITILLRLIKVNTRNHNRQTRTFRRFHQQSRTFINNVRGLLRSITRIARLKLNRRRPRINNKSILLSRIAINSPHLRRQQHLTINLLTRVNRLRNITSRHNIFRRFLLNQVLLNISHTTSYIFARMDNFRLQNSNNNRHISLTPRLLGVTNIRQMVRQDVNTQMNQRILMLHFDLTIIFSTYQNFRIRNMGHRTKINNFRTGLQNARANLQRFIIAFSNTNVNSRRRMTHTRLDPISLISTIRRANGHIFVGATTQSFNLLRIDSLNRRIKTILRLNQINMRFHNMFRTQRHLHTKTRHSRARLSLLTRILQFSLLVSLTSHFTNTISMQIRKGHQISSGRRHHTRFLRLTNDLIINFLTDNNTNFNHTALNILIVQFTRQDSIRRTHTRTTFDRRFFTTRRQRRMRLLLRISRVFEFFNRRTKYLLTFFRDNARQYSFTRQIQHVRSTFSHNTFLRRRRTITINQINRNRYRLRLPLNNTANKRPTGNFTMTIQTSFRPFNINNLNTLVRMRATRNQLHLTNDTTHDQTSLTTQHNRRTLRRNFFANLGRQFIVNLKPQTSTRHRRHDTTRRRSARKQTRRFYGSSGHYLTSTLFKS